MQYLQHQGQSLNSHSYHTQYQRQRLWSTIGIVIGIAALVAAAWYWVLSEHSLFATVLAANIVATPDEARGTPFNDDGTPFLALAEDSVQQRSDADPLHASHPDSVAGAGVVRYSDGNIIIRQRSNTPSSFVPSARVQSSTAFDGSSVHSSVQPAGESNAVVVQLTTKYSLWVRVRRDDAPKSRDYMLRAGQKREWKATTSVALSLGHTRGVRLTLNGKPYSIAHKPDRVIRNLLLSSTSLALEFLP